MCRSRISLLLLCAAPGNVRKAQGRPPKRVPRGSLFSWLTVYDLVYDLVYDTSGLLRTALGRCQRECLHSRAATHTLPLTHSLPVCHRFRHTHTYTRIMAYPAPMPGWCGPTRKLRGVARLVRFGSTRTLRVAAVVAVARLARCAWLLSWLWLGSHTVRAGGGAAGASQQLDAAEGNARY